MGRERVSKERGEAANKREARREEKGKRGERTKDKK